MSVQIFLLHIYEGFMAYFYVVQYPSMISNKSAIFFACLHSLNESWIRFGSVSLHFCNIICTANISNKSWNEGWNVKGRGQKLGTVGPSYAMPL